MNEPHTYNEPTNIRRKYSSPGSSWHSQMSKKGTKKLTNSHDNQDKTKIAPSCHTIMLDIDKNPVSH